MAANTSEYDEIRKESRHMCEAFQELFKDEIDEKVKAGERRGRLEGEREGRREGEREGRLATLIGLAKDNLITISEAAKRAEMTEALFTEKMTNFGK
jgi:predicted transposase YdaD